MKKKKKKTGMVVGKVPWLLAGDNFWPCRLSRLDMNLVTCACLPVSSKAPPNYIDE
jgi:hypothetical protein